MNRCPHCGGDVGMTPQRTVSALWGRPLRDEDLPPAMQEALKQTAKNAKKYRVRAARRLKGQGE